MQRLFQFVLLVVLILGNTSCVYADNPGERRVPFVGGLLGLDRKETAPLLEIDKQTPSELRNPGFEELDAEGNPVGWKLNRVPTVRSEEVGGEINHYARVGRDIRFSQIINYPVPTWQSITIGANVRAEMGIERPQMIFQKSTGWDGPARPVTDITDWSPFYASVTRLPSESGFALYIQSRGNLWWIDYDDLSMLFENPPAGDFESEPPAAGWSFEGAAAITTEQPLSDGRSLLLGGGGEASVLVAHTPEVVEYFVTGLAVGSFTLEEQRLDPAGRIADGTTSFTISMESPGRFFHDLPRSGEAHAARLVFRNESAVPARIDNVSRGWAYAWPKVFEPVANSTRPTVRLAAAWPGNLEFAEITIIDSEGITRHSITSLQQSGTTVWADYDGTGITPGDYTARFLLHDSEGTVLSADRPFSMVAGPRYPDAPMALRYADFKSVAWIFTIPYTELDVRDTIDAYVADLSVAREDGFNMLWLAVEERQFDLLPQALEEVGLPYILWEPSISDGIIFDKGNRTWDAATMVERFDAFEPFMDSELFAGIYIFDEPNIFGRQAVDRTRDIQIQMERDPRLPPGFTALNPGSPRQTTVLNQIETFQYPILQRMVGEDSIGYFLETVEKDAMYADLINRDYWFGMQGVAGPGNFEAPTYAETMAQLASGLAIGGRGYFTFLYGPLAGSSSVLTFDFQRQPRADAYADFHTRIAAINDTVMSLRPERAAPPQENLIARTGEDQFGTPHLILVNKETNGILTFQVYTESETTLTNIETSQALTEDPALAHTGTLAPGDWAIYRLADDVGIENATGELEDTSEHGHVDVPVLMRIMGENVSRMAVRPGGQHVATVSGRRVSVLSMDENMLGNPIFEVPYSSGLVRVSYLDHETLLLANDTLGFRLYKQTGDNFEEQYAFERETGGAADVIPFGDDLWVAQTWWGTSLIKPGADGQFERLGRFPSEEFDYLQLLGPYGDSVLALENVRGLYRITRTAEGLRGERLQQDRGSFNLGELSPDGRRFAAPALDSGVRVYEIDEEGNLVRDLKIYEERIQECESVAWLSNDLLAVGDNRRGVRFYRLYDNGAWTYEGMWEPAEAPFVIVALAGLGDGRFLVSLRDGNLLLADGRGIVVSGRTSGWFTY